MWPGWFLLQPWGRSCSLKAGRNLNLEAAEREEGARCAGQQFSLPARVFFECPGVSGPVPGHSSLQPLVDWEKASCLCSLKEGAS